MHAILLLAAAIVSAAGFLDSLFYVPNANCGDNEFACLNGKCIKQSKMCDNHPDCTDSSDELDCEMLLCKSPNFFRCNNSRCISSSFICDGENDCEDFSDEHNCENFKKQLQMNSSCQANEWQCTDKLCIVSEWVCNGEEDCLDGSDEMIGCSTKIDCDGFKCRNGHCIVNEWICDGNNDCNDNSDEENCGSKIEPKDCNWDTRHFLCSDNKTCINITDVCDGKNQCADGSDEGNLCKSTTLTCASHDCSHECVQLPTGPKCLCPKGYHNIDEKHCEDINECDIYGICDQKCRNTPGSYQCSCDRNYTLQDDQRTCKATNGQGTMFFSSKSEIRAYLMEAEVYYPVATKLKQVVGVAFDGRYVYWTDIFSEHESIVRSGRDGVERELLVTSGLGAPEDLDIDWVTGNIYFTDAERQHIGVCVNDGSRCTVLVNKDVDKPRGIALNCREGEMFWTDWGKKPEIARALMDGSQDTSFVSIDIHWPNGLAIDFANERLYWTDAKVMTLESIRLDGTDRRIILEGVVKHPYAIAVFEDRLYWSDWSTHSIQSCDKFSGKNHHTLIKEKKEYIYGIHIYHPNLYHTNRNPCLLSLCSDICLLSGATYVCACPQGKELSLDGHTCRDLEKKQILVLGAGNLLIRVEHQFLGKHEISTLPVVVKKIGALAYNSINNVLYISDIESHKLIQFDLHSGSARPMEIDDLGEITAMDYDYLGNNLYWCDSLKGSVEVTNLNTMSRKVLLHDMNWEIPESIALIPNEGVMFVAFKKPHTKTTHIDRIYMDGSSRTHPLESGVLGPISLCYDDDLHRVFIADAGTGNIETTSVDGDDRHGFRALQTSPISITSLKSDVFWVNEHSRRLYWADKHNMPNDHSRKITLDIPEDIRNMHIISTTRKHVTPHPCLHNNGNCSHLCLLSQKNIVCACPTNMILQNNKTCSHPVECASNEFFCFQSNACIPKEMHCDGKNNCEMGEDEKNCKVHNRCSAGHFQCADGECIKQEFRCDHHYECKDKSDEINCINEEGRRCPPDHFRCNNGQCVIERFVCNGVPDCFNGEDEENCDSNTCGATQFRCTSGACIPKNWECDHEYDCSDLSDEHSNCRRCPSTMFSCANGKCVDNYFVCDNENDCGDNSDEINCGHNDCGPDFFLCTSNRTICVPNKARCNGTSECPHHEDEKDCSDCHVEEFTCENKKCIPTQWLCDHSDDCGDNSDELPAFCSHPHNFTNQLQGSCEEYRCKSGSCVNLSLVCNDHHDCYDGSDEGGVCQTACDGVNNPCSHVCVKTPSGPMCKCRSGYKLLGDGHNCEDANECLNDPPVCSQLCINEPGSYTCDCYQGFILRSDKVSCKAEGEAMAMIFATEDEIRKSSQMENSLCLLYSEETSKISGLDVSVKEETIYFTIENSGTIHRINTKTKVREYLDRIGQPQKMALDWSTNNVYFVNADVRKFISVCNFEDKMCAKLTSIDTHSQVSSLVVDSLNKVMFYSVVSWWMFNSPTYLVYKRNLDGTGAEELVKSTSGYITGLAYDLHKKQLFYVDHHKGQLNRVNYDGTMNTVILSNLTRPMGLNFFENKLYFSTTGGFMAKCQLYDVATCDNFKLHSSSTEFFVIAQESRQPHVENVCQNHTCSDICVPTNLQYKCLCRDGKLITSGDKCSSTLRDSESHERNSVKYSHFVVDNNSGHSNGAIIAAVLIPICFVLLAGVFYYLINKRNRGNFTLSAVRFHNPIYGLQNDDETNTNKCTILQPGQNEYINPLIETDDKSVLLVDV